MKKNKEKNYCLSTLEEGYESYSFKAVKLLFDSQKVNPRTSIAYTSGEYTDNVTKVSISGVQEKMFAVIEHGELRLARTGEQSHYIIKPIPANLGLRNRHDIPMNEHLTMQIAGQVYGIQTAANGLIYLKNGSLAYIVKRFDISTDGKKYYQEDMASLLGKSVLTHGTDYKYTGSYLEIARVLRKVMPIWKFDLPKLFSLIIFNYLFSNGDAHLKNFSIRKNEKGLLTLAPAYDLLNTSLHVNDSDFALSGGLGITDFSDAYDRTGHPAMEDFISFATDCGLTDRQISKEIKPFLDKQDMVYALCDRSFLSDKAKRMYVRSYEERLMRLLRSK